MKLGILIFLSFLLSCSTSKNLVYIDDWEGQYNLWELSSCCNKKTLVVLNVERKGLNNYNWKLYNSFSTNDTLTGLATYTNKKLNFFVNNKTTATNYFKDKLNTNLDVFSLMYDNYSNENGKLHIGNFTSWRNYLNGYESHHALFSATDFHFRKGNNEQIILIDSVRKKSIKAK